MTDGQHADRDDLIYMITGEDQNGDTHIFVTSDLGRAAARHDTALRQFENVRANWLDEWEGRSRPTQ